MTEESQTPSSTTPVESVNNDTTTSDAARAPLEEVDWKAKFEKQREITRKLEERNKNDLSTNTQLQERLNKLEQAAFEKDKRLIAKTYEVPEDLLIGQSSDELEDYAKKLSEFIQARSESQSSTTPRLSALQKQLQQPRSVDEKDIKNARMNNFIRTEIMRKN